MWERNKFLYGLPFCTDLMQFHRSFSDLIHPTRLKCNENMMLNSFTSPSAVTSISRTLKETRKNKTFQFKSELNWFAYLSYPKTDCISAEQSSRSITDGLCTIYVLELASFDAMYMVKKNN